LKHNSILGDKVSFTYEAECSVLKAVTLSINFEGSVNFAIDDFGTNGGSEAGNAIISFFEICLSAEL